MTLTSHDHDDPVALAAEYLIRSGLRVLDTKWRHGSAGLDIVAADRHILVACDVRTSPTRRHQPPPGRLSPARLRQLRELAVAWMDTHGTRFEQIRVDTVTLIWDGPGGYTIEHIRGAGQ